MKLVRLHQGAEHLLLIMGGWGTDARPFAHLAADGWEVWLAYDYGTAEASHGSTRPASSAPLSATESNSPSLQHTPLLEAIDWSHFRHHHLAAWSMGVWAAEALLAPHAWTSATAINGTPCPIDDLMGIPSAIAQGTLETLDDANLTRFERRMCGSRDQYDSYLKRQPQRSLESLKDELAWIIKHASHHTPTPHIQWTHAVIGTQDRIFPTTNQQRYWRSTPTPTRLIEQPHYPFNSWTSFKQLAQDSGN